MQHSLVKGVNAIVDRLTAGTGTENVRTALADSTRVAEDMVNYLKENDWAPKGVMTLEQVGKTYEFFAYMALLHSQTRKRSLALTFQPTQQVYEFALELMNREKEKESKTGDVNTVTASQVTPDTPAHRGNTCSGTTVRNRRSPPDGGREHPGPRGRR